METIEWATESFLGADHSIRAVETYSKLLTGNIGVLGSINRSILSSRFFDHVTILASLEVQISESYPVENRNFGSVTPYSPKFPRSASIEAMATTVGWAGLTESLKVQQVCTVKVLMSILRLHAKTLDKSDEITLLDNPLLFWISAR